MKQLILPFVLLVTSMVMAQINDESVIRKSRDASNAAIASKDLDGVSKFWLDDFVMVRGSGAQVVGKPANIEVWLKMFKETPSTTFIRNPLEIIVGSGGDMAWETGEWEGRNTYSKGGKYAAMWRKIKNEWKLQSELFVALK